MVNRFPLFPNIDEGVQSSTSNVVRVALPYTASQLAEHQQRFDLYQALCGAAAGSATEAVDMDWRRFMAAVLSPPLFSLATQYISRLSIWHSSFDSYFRIVKLLQRCVDDDQCPETLALLNRPDYAQSATKFVAKIVRCCADGASQLGDTLHDQPTHFHGLHDVLAFCYDLIDTRPRHWLYCFYEHGLFSALVHLCHACAFLLRCEWAATLFDIFRQSLILTAAHDATADHDLKIHRSMVENLTVVKKHTDHYMHAKNVSIWMLITAPCSLLMCLHFSCFYVWFFVCCILMCIVLSAMAAVTGYHLV